MKQNKLSIIRCIPGLKYALVVLVGSLVLGVLHSGFHPAALYALIFGGAILLLTTLRNFDPRSFDSYLDDGRISPQLMNTILTALENLTAAVEQDDMYTNDEYIKGTGGSSNPIVGNALMARQTLNAFVFSQRTRST